MNQVIVENQQLCATDLKEDLRKTLEIIAENAVAKAKLKKNLSHEN